MDSLMIQGFTESWFPKISWYFLISCTVWLIFGNFWINIQTFTHIVYESQAYLLKTPWQCQTHTILFLNSTGVLERSKFVILEKIARVVNDTWSRSFREYWLLQYWLFDYRLLLAMANCVTMETTLPVY